MIDREKFGKYLNHKVKKTCASCDGNDFIVYEKKGILYLKDHSGDHSTEAMLIHLLCCSDCGLLMMYSPQWSNE